VEEEIKKIGMSERGCFELIKMERRTEINCK